MSNTQIGQKEAVVKAVAAALGSKFEIGINAREVLTAEQITEIKNEVTAGIMAGTVSYSKELDEKSVRRYVAGLVDNHLRKAKELNGGVKYSAATTRGPREAKEDKPAKVKDNGIDMSVLPSDLQSILSSEA